MAKVTPRDRDWMAMALALARRGVIGTAPNPRVGCVLVRDGEVLSSGWHEQVGEAHAEAHALRCLPSGKTAEGATAYVTLEPCSHHGRTPPCSDALIRAGIARCVVGTVDPNPKVSGQGIERMRDAGIDVTVLDDFPEGRWLNRRFLSAMERDRPWIVLKCAVSADGFMDPPRAPGETGSKAVTSSALRRLTHQWRAEEGAILVGAGTVATDDPQLDVREAQGPSPLRVVLDPRGRTSSRAKVYQGPGRTLVLGGPDGVLPTIERLPVTPEGTIPAMLEALHQRDIRSVLVEGGADTLRRFMEGGHWDELRICRSAVQLGSGLKAPDWPSEEEATVRGMHPFGTDHVEYRVHPDSARWAGTCPPPTLSVAFP